MAIQTTSNFVYNYATYQTPYIRLDLQLAKNGLKIPVSCLFYPSKEDYDNYVQPIFGMLFEIDVTNVSTDNDATDVVNKYLLFVTEKIVLELQKISPSSTFEIVGIPMNQQ